MTALVRLPDWAARLTCYWVAVQGQPFRIGQLDCALFTAGAIEAMTGTDLARGWRGYRSRAEGLRALAREGFASPIDLVAARLPEVAPIRAAPGDVAVFATPEGLATGILQGPHIYAMGPNAPGTLPRDALLRAFRV